MIVVYRREIVSIPFFCTVFAFLEIQLFGDLARFVSRALENSRRKSVIWKHQQPVYKRRSLAEDYISPRLWNGICPPLSTAALCNRVRTWLQMFQTHLRRSDTSSHVLRAKSSDSEFLRKPRVCKNGIGTISRWYATIILTDNIKLSLCRVRIVEGWTVTLGGYNS